MREQEHNYEIYEFKNGFKIVPRDENRPPVYAIVNKYGFWSIKSKKQKSNYSYIPLYNYYYLSDKVVEVLYDTWVSPREKDFKGDGHKHLISTWAKKTTSKTLSRKMRDIWKRVCLSFDPRIEELHRKLYSVSNGSGDWARVEHVIKNRVKFKYLIDDMLKYHAARVAVLHGTNTPDYNRYYNSCSYDWDTDWKNAYLYNEYDENYTSLTKTLMNLPRGMAYYHLFNLKFGRLPEPATTRMKLWAYCMLYSSEHRYTADLEKVIRRSSDETIRKAIRYMWHYFPVGHETFRGDKGIRHALQLIFDYPMAIGKWDMLGLAKRSEVYHHDIELQNREQELIWAERRAENLEKQKKLEISKTALPPISLPKNENIKFLDSFNDVIEEGKIMQHCIASYAEKAVEGHCYLFHVDYNGHTASVEVAPNGFVIQSYGPRDTRNDASEYGRKILNKWAKELNGKMPVLRDEKSEEEKFEFTYRIGAQNYVPALLEGIPF